MFNSNSGYSLADIAAATGNERNNSGWGDSGAWWIIILFLFCFAGWGGKGFGNAGGAGSALTRDELMQGFDFSGLRSDVMGLQNSISNGFYNANTNALNGFANAIEANNSGVRAIQSDICGMGLTNLQNTNAITNAINADTIANMQNTFQISQQLNNMQAQQEACCCQTKELLAANAAELNYNLATQACQNRQVVTDNTRDIIENANNNTRQVLDFLVQDKIDTLNAENAALKGMVSQSEQNAYLISQLGQKTPIPAYVVQNPYNSNGCTGCTTTF